ncbi:MAG TPA: 50S ribosomal protein L32 [Spirochaetota bacterium]|nr:50S ribosomal protein L32 [Spirochaetota bacterium]
MALPKFRKSKSKTKMRRKANDKRKPQFAGKCPDCGALKLPHQVCPECGMYKGKTEVRK